MCSYVHAGHGRRAVAVARVVARDRGRSGLVERQLYRRQRGRRWAVAVARGDRPPRLVVDALAGGEARGHADRARLLETDTRRRRGRGPQGLHGVGRARASPVHRLLPRVVRTRRRRRDQREGEWIVSFSPRAYLSGPLRSRRNGIHYQTVKSSLLILRVRRVDFPRLYARGTIENHYALKVRPGCFYVRETISHTLSSTLHFASVRFASCSFFSAKFCSYHAVRLQLPLLVSLAVRSA